MKLFEALRKIRAFERQNLPVLKTIIDFDIVIEIGFAEEQGRPLTLKHLMLLHISSKTTVRRRLSVLIKQGVVVKQKQSNDHRSYILTISPASYRQLYKYGTTLTEIAGSIPPGLQRK